MNQRVVRVCLVVGFLVAGFSNLLARGPCKMDVNVIQCAVPDVTDDAIVRVVGLLDKRCATEGKSCRRQATCETVYADVMCIPPGDGEPSSITIGLGCFCGGGSPPVPMQRQDPVSADEALRIIEAIEAADAESPALCEAPPDPAVKK